MGKSTEGFLANPSDVLFLHPDMFKLLQNLREAPTAHELHGHPQLVLDSERVIIAHDVRVLTFLHNVDLRCEKLDVLGVESHFLYRHILFGPGASRDEDLTCCTLPNLSLF